MALIKTIQKYKACWDILIALGLIISMIIVIMFTCMIIRNRGESLTTEYILLVAIGLSIGVALLVSSVTYFCIQYRAYRFKDTGDRYRLVSVSSGSQCAICLTSKDSETEPIAALTCTHEFHQQCVRKLLDKSENCVCPLCRQPLNKF